MAPTVSTIGPVLDALVALARSALPDAQVFDGPPTEEMTGRLVMVGWGGPDQPGVTSTRIRQQYATSPDTESYDVACLLCCWLGGENNLKAVRDGALAMLDSIGAALAANPRLDGLVKRCRISAETYVPEQTTDGAAATLLVSFHVDANTG
jgi:hypothetical protein